MKNGSGETNSQVQKSTGKMNRNIRIGNIAIIGILSAISYVLMWLEVPAPLMPPFIKFDFSDFPALLAAFGIGPVAGILVELIKNILHSFSSGSFAVGELSNFILGSCFVGVAGLFYRRKKTKKSAVIASLLGALSMALISYPSNLFVVYPFYDNFMPKETVLSLYQLILPSVGSMERALLIFNLPFTFIKGMLDVLLCLLLYKSISPLLHKFKN